MFSKIFSETSLSPRYSETDEISKVFEVIDKTHKYSLNSYLSFPRYFDSFKTLDFSITSFDFSADGSSLAIGCFSGSLHYLNFLDPKRDFTIKAHEKIEYVVYQVAGAEENVANIHSVSFDDEALLIATGSEDCSVKVWDVNSQKEVCMFSGHRFAVKCVLFGIRYKVKVLVSSDLFGDVKVWSIKEKKETFSIKLHEAGTISLKFSKNFDLIASAAKDSIKIFSLGSKKETFSLEFNNKNCKIVNFSQDLSRFWHHSEDEKVIKCFRVKDQKEEVAVELEASPMTFLVTPDELYIILLFKEKLVVYNLQDKREEYTCIEIDTLFLSSSLNISSSGTLAIGRGENLYISKIFETFDDLEFHPKIKYYSWFSPNDEHLIMFHSESVLSFYKILEKKEDFTIPITSFVEELSFSPNSEFFGIVLREELLKIIRTSDNFELLSLKLPKYRNAFCFTPDSLSVIFHLEDFLLVVWDINNNQETSRIDLKQQQATFLEFTKNSEFLVAVLKPSILKVWFWSNLKDFEINHSESIKCFSLHPNGRFCACGLVNWKIAVFNLKCQRVEFEFSGHSREIVSICFEGTGECLASASKDCTVKLWNFWDRRLQMIINLNHELIDLSFSKNSRFLAFSTVKGRVSVYDLKFKRKPKIFNSFEQDGLTFGWFYDSKFYLFQGNKKKSFNCEMNPDFHPTDFKISENVLTIFDENSNFQQNFQLNGPEMLETPTFCSTFEKNPILFDPSSFYCNRDFGIIEFDNVFYSLATRKFNDMGPGFSRVCFSNLKITGLHLLSHLGEGQVIKSLLLKYKPEFFTDFYGHSPLFYSIFGRHQQTTDMFIEYFIDSTEAKDDILMINLKSLRTDFKAIISNSSQSLNGFLETCFFTINERPIFASPGDRLPLFRSMETSTALIKDFCSTSLKTNLLPLNIKTFFIEVPTGIGSQASIEMMEAIINCTNEEIFRTEFIRFYLRLRWNAAYFYILSYCVLQWVNILFVTLLVKNSENMKIYTIFLALCNLPLLIWELLQFNSLKLYYLQDPTNMYSAIRLVLTFVWLGCKYYSIYSRWFTWIALFFNLFEGLVGFKAFDVTRFYLRLLSTSINNIKYFVLLFIYTTFCFALLSSGSPEKDSKIDLSFENLWMISYGLVYGDFDRMNSLRFDTQYITLASAIFINIILMLNLIISILGDAFDEFQLKSEIYDCREMANVLLEVDQVLSFRKKRNESRFIHVCMNAYSGSQGFWKGKVLDFRSYVDELKGFIDETLDDRIKKIGSDMESKLGGVNKRVNELFVKVDQNAQKNEIIDEKLEVILSLLKGSK